MSMCPGRTGAVPHLWHMPSPGLKLCLFPRTVPLYLAAHLPNRTSVSRGLPSTDHAHNHAGRPAATGEDFGQRDCPCGTPRQHNQKWEVTGHSILDTMWDIRGEDCYAGLKHKRKYHKLITFRTSVTGYFVMGHVNGQPLLVTTFLVNSHRCGLTTTHLNMKQS